MKQFGSSPTEHSVSVTLSGAPGLTLHLQTSFALSLISREESNALKYQVFKLQYVHVRLCLDDPERGRVCLCLCPIFPPEAAVSWQLGAKQ